MPLEGQRPGNMKILVTGGAGYIGSHTVLELLRSGHSVVVYDSLEKSTLDNLTKIRELTGTEIPFVKGNILDKDLFSKTLQDHKPEAIMHFAAYKNAGESVEKPSEYYQNNVVGSKIILDAMLDNGINKVIFSSTCAVYGNPEELPVTEKTPLDPISPYGKSKLMVERMLNDYQSAYGLNSVALRYFNAAGADESGDIGEETSSTANIIPLIIENLLGNRDEFLLFGDQFDTADGTQERDYIHVTDLARAHVKALDYLSDKDGYHFFNLGTGVPTSNKTLIELGEKVSGMKLKYNVISPREGDPEKIYAGPSKSEKELGWKAEFDIEDIIKTAWKWHSTK